MYKSNLLPTVPPSSLISLQEAYMQTQILISSVELNIFTYIAQGHVTVAALAIAIGCTERAARILVDAVAALGLIEKRGQQYFLTEESTIYLVKGSSTYAGDAVLLQEKMRERIGHLTEVILTGEPLARTNELREAEVFFPHLASLLFKPHYPVAKAVATFLEIGQAKCGSRVLDIASGSGVWSIAIAERDPSIRVTAHDFPLIIQQVTKRFVEEYGLSQQYDFLEGDLNKVNFGEEHFDIIILGHILHSEGEIHSRHLLKKVNLALQSTGVVIIAEKLLDETLIEPMKVEI